MNNEDYPQLTKEQRDKMSPASIEKYEAIRTSELHNICSRCNSSSQVWINQITGKATCHRVGCNNRKVDQ
jgi:hypothetical protein